jgi:hypothetical protein
VLKDQLAASGSKDDCPKHAAVAPPTAAHVTGLSSTASTEFLEMHCRAIAFAAALCSISGNINPARQTELMHWKLHRLIAADDVGAENIGRAPSPWLTPDLHVQYPAGTFVGGTPAQVHILTKRYAVLGTGVEKLTMLLCSFGLVQPRQDADAALTKIFPPAAKAMIAAIEGIDPFWPAYCRRWRIMPRCIFSRGSGRTPNSETSMSVPESVILHGTFE